jgi:DNA repair protein RadC
MNNTISEIEIKYTPIIKKQDRIKITCSQDAYRVFLNNWNGDTIELQEEFKIMLLNKANEVMGISVLSKGSMSSCIVDLKLLFAVVIKSASPVIILAHNHPSGNLKPSEADKRLYEKVKKGAEYFDIQVLDNLIITKEDFYSFTDRGL